ncbi:hypothetical protein [Halosegnis marinus]|uniref:Uncharacterized protein n=1 Tax=Halosegnis marinus TaxID=3034023 RepID=A0ABD5ZQC5_9EURY|nr:hypothetical protein [Halosegnis sp. DT85]
MGAIPPDLDPEELMAVFDTSDPAEARDGYLDTCSALQQELARVLREEGGGTVTVTTSELANRVFAPRRAVDIALENMAEEDGSPLVPGRRAETWEITEP